MERIEIKQLNASHKEHAGKEVTVCGWVRTLRDTKSFGFIEINDGSFMKNLQIVFDDGLENFQDITRLNVGSAICVKGVVVYTPNARQPYEIKAKAISILGTSHPEYPLQKKRHTFEYLRTISHLRPRTNTFSAVFRVRSVLSHAIHNFFQERGFVYVHTPIITSSDCEGAGEMFQVTTLDLDNLPRTEGGEINYEEDFFGKQTGLTVSGQLAVEPYCMAFGKVYTFGPTFRAENSNTSRHAAEFWMVEPEIAFADLNDNMKLAEDMIRYIIQYVLDHARPEMDFFNAMIDKGLYERLNYILNSDFGCVSYTEAIEMLIKSDHEFQYPVKWGCDLQTEHERFLTEMIMKKPVFVINYPKEIKAFYMRDNEDGKTVAAMDLLVPGVGEIIGGSQREERLEVLEKKMDDFRLNKEEYAWYLDTRRFGGTQHAGFGLGFERMLMYITGMPNIRDVVPYPRTVKNAMF